MFPYTRDARRGSWNTHRSHTGGHQGKYHLMWNFTLIISKWVRSWLAVFICSEINATMRWWCLCQQKRDYICNGDLFIHVALRIPWLTVTHMGKKIRKLKLTRFVAAWGLVPWVNKFNFQVFEPNYRQYGRCCYGERMTESITLCTWTCRGWRL